MKAGIIDIFAESFGWVLGKAALFALAVITGIGMGACALWAGTVAGGGGFGFSSGSHPVHGHLAVITALLPQVLLIFWAAMIFVRSERAETKHWVAVAGMEALALTGSFCRALPSGFFAQLAAWAVVTTLIILLAKIIGSVERRQAKRGVDHLEQLQLENAIRRQEMKRKFGTESTGAQELGIL